MCEMRAGTTRGPVTAQGPGRRRLTALSVSVSVAEAAALGWLPACASVTAITAGSAATAPAGRALAACVSGTCWVDVSVATAWVKPWYPRGVDKPALGNPGTSGYLGSGYEPRAEELAGGKA